MAKTATIQTRVDPVIKNNAQIILKKLNISMSEAISMYLSEFIVNDIFSQFKSCIYSRPRWYLGELRRYENRA